MLFDEPRDEYTTRELELPEAPPFPEVRVEQPEEAPLTETTEPVPLPGQVDEGTAPQEDDAQWTLKEGKPGDSPSTAPAPTVEEENKQETKAAGPAGESDRVLASEDGSGEVVVRREPKSLEGAWLLQLGSFGNTGNARKLRDSVVEKGYDAYLTEFTRDGKTLTRVIAGPFVSRALAEKAKARLDPLFSINGLVMAAE